MTDEGVRHISALKNLTELWLYNTYHVTNKGLRHIRDLTDLKVLNVYGTEVTKEAFEQGKPGEPTVIQKVRLTNALLENVRIKLVTEEETSLGQVEEEITSEFLEELIKQLVYREDALLYVQRKFESEGRGDLLKKKFPQHFSRAETRSMAEDILALDTMRTSIKKGRYAFILADSVYSQLTPRQRMDYEKLLRDNSKNRLVIYGPKSEASDDSLEESDLTLRVTRWEAPSSEHVEALSRQGYFLVMIGDQQEKSWQSKIQSSFPQSVNRVLWAQYLGRETGVPAAAVLIAERLTEDEIHALGGRIFDRHNPQFEDARSLASDLFTELIIARSLHSSA